MSKVPDEPQLNPEQANQAFDKFRVAPWLQAKEIQELFTHIDALIQENTKLKTGSPSQAKDSLAGMWMQVQLLKKTLHEHDSIPGTLKHLGHLAISYFTGKG